MIRSRLTSVLVVTAMLLLPTLVAAQEGPMPLTWVGMFKVKAGAEPQFEKAFEKYDKPLFDQLVWPAAYLLSRPATLMGMGIQNILM